MKKYLLLLQIFAWLVVNGQNKVEINTNMELVGLMYTIVYENPDNPRFDTTDPDWEYGQWLVNEYGHFGEDPLLEELLPRIEHLWISDFFSLLTRVEQFPNATPQQAKQFLESNLIPELLDLIESAKNSGLNLNNFFKNLI